MILKIDLVTNHLFDIMNQLEIKTKEVEIAKASNDLKRWQAAIQDLRETKEMLSKKSKQPKCHF